MDKIFSRPYSKEGRDNWDRIFKPNNWKSKEEFAKIEAQWKKEFEDDKQRFREWVANNTTGCGGTPLDEENQ